MSIHSLEILIAEAERVRNVENKITTVPRFSDIYSIRQTAKFELSEIDDSYDNRMNILDNIISESIKKACSFYLLEIPAERLINVKNEFKINKTFVVSQDITGNSKTSKSYHSQLNKFNSLSEVMKIVNNNIIQDQNNFEEKFGDMTTGPDQHDSTKNPEYLASVTELILEGLRFTDPPILDRKEGLYVHV